MLSMHELSLPEPMMSLSMLILVWLHVRNIVRHLETFSTFGTFLDPGNNVPGQHSIEPSQMHYSDKNVSVETWNILGFFYHTEEALDLMRRVSKQRPTISKAMATTIVRAIALPLLQP